MKIIGGEPLVSVEILIRGRTNELTRMAWTPTADVCFFDGENDITTSFRKTDLLTSRHLLKPVAYANLEGIT
jgi:hypothetical protein